MNEYDLTKHIAFTRGWDACYKRYVTDKAVDEPSKCPTCGSEYRQVKRKLREEKTFTDFCNNPWHDEPKAPTHEEIMTKWWGGCGEWVKVDLYNANDPKRPYEICGVAYDPGWFINRESADIPPCI